MANRELLMLAHDFEADKYGVGNWFCSEKLDGVRCFWDGGISRGLFCDQVPFANVEKDSRYLSRPKATGLWSRYGKPIMAPDWWLDLLPDSPLDGELYMGRGRFQDTISCVKQLTPDERWHSVRYMVFDSPHLEDVLIPGKINNPNLRKYITSDQISWAMDRALTLGTEVWRFSSFESFYHHMRPKLVTEVVEVLEHIQLPPITSAAMSVIYEELDRVVGLGGEGLILRNPSSRWEPIRSRKMLKVKKMLDGTGKVTGYTWGRQTDRGSKLLGLMGALILDWNGQRFELSGFTEDERQLHYNEFDPAGRIGLPANDAGFENPGRTVGIGISSLQFPLGSYVDFKYRELTDSGLPKEARYWRKR